MTAPLDLEGDLEDRLRTGLHAAAGALPPAPSAAPAGEPGARRARFRTSVLARAPRRRWARTVVAAAATLAAVAGTAVVLTRDGAGDDDQAEVATGTSTEGEQPHQVRMVNGMVPGEATADRDGTALRTFGPDGQPTGEVDLGMTNVQAATSDLDGGWVVCGMVTNPEAEAGDGDEVGGPPGEGDGTTTVPVTPGGLDADAQAAREAAREQAAEEFGDAEQSAPQLDVGDMQPAPVLERLTWYPAGGAPVPLEINGGFPACSENSVQVVDSADGPIALVGGLSFGGETPGVRLDAIVLATGEHRELPVPDLPGLPGSWSATTGRVLANFDGIGLRLYDVDQAEEVPIAAIDPGDISHLALAHDGETAAVLKGTIEGPDEVIVYDLATGAEIYRRSFPMSIEGDQLSYDGKTLAVGNYYAADGPITVIDVATGAEHTVAAGGVVL